MNSSADTPLVTIAIPTYQGEDYLKETLSSALSQTYPHLEILVSDDGSTDRTVEIAEKLKAKTSHDYKIVSHRRFGMINNWNFCVSTARGKYIKFLFQDDLLKPTCVEEMVELAQSDREVGLVFSPRTVLLSKGAGADRACRSVYLGCRELHKSWSNLQRIQFGYELLKDPYLLVDPINKIGEPSTVLIKREVFEKVGLFDVNLCQVVDVDMWLKIMGYYKIGFIDKKLSSFRVHIKQQTRQNIHSGESELDTLRLYRKMLKHSSYSFLSSGLKQQIRFKASQLEEKIKVQSSTEETSKSQKLNLRSLLSSKKLETPKYQGQIHSVKLFVTSFGNYFMWEIARIFEEGFQNNSVSVELAVDKIPTSTPEAGLMQIIVAPHEFYPLFLEVKLSEIEILEITRNVYLLNVEQPGSPWFEIAWQISRLSKGVFDINQQGIDEFRKRDIPALHTPLGYTSVFEAKISDTTSLLKSVDIVFIGANSKRRELFISKNADWLSKHNCRLILTKFEKPSLKDTPGFYAEKKRNELLNSSKILINIHFADRTYFEWHRVLMAIANRCLVISEPSDYTEPLVGDRHIVFAEPETLDEVCQYYLNNEDERVKIAEQAYEFVTNYCTSKAVCHSLLNTLIS